jgi:integrase
VKAISGHPAVQAAPSGEGGATLAGAGHVLGEQCRIDLATARLAALIDARFLTETGWDPGGRVPPAHALLGWRVCQSQGCDHQVYGRNRMCGVCQGTKSVSPQDDQRDLARSCQARACQVEACPRDRGRRRYCRAHYERLLNRRRDDLGFDEARWRRIEPAVEASGQVSLHGIPVLVLVQVLYGLQQRTRDGAKSTVAVLRQIAGELRQGQPASLGNLALDTGSDHHKLLRCFARDVGRAGLHPETEWVKDVWDLSAFGLSGNLTFTKISQGWLRESAKRWAADDLPRRRGKRAAAPVQHYLTGLAALSDSLRTARPDHGDNQTLLGRNDIDVFLQRLAFLATDKRMSTDARIRTCRELKHLLGRIRALGLTRPGGPAAGLGEDFTLARSDVPEAPEAAEANRDLPAEIMRQLCDQLPVLEHTISSRESRVAVELLLDTGRRPDEICALPWDCLEYDEGGQAPVLIYDNHKNARHGRRLPIAQTTAELIISQKDHVRERFPNTPLAKLKLFPAAKSNPDGRVPITEYQLSSRHRVWIDALPPLLRADGTEYDKTRIVPYAYRHTYAQRHADAGVPIDVLGTLMDHRSLNTTKHYYRVGHDRRREAIDRVTALQFDRHGNRIWATAKTLLDSEHARRAIGEVAVPFGTCAEPSNVKAGGHACPYRFRCTGCDHFRTDISYLPDLSAYLDDLLRTRERLTAAIDGVDDWARADATPTEEEITRIRRLINRIKGDLSQLTQSEQDSLHESITVIRRHRAVSLGMPAIRATTPASEAPA